LWAPTAPVPTPPAIGAPSSPAPEVAGWRSAAGRAAPLEQSVRRLPGRWRSGAGRCVARLGGGRSRSGPCVGWLGGGAAGAARASLAWAVAHSERPLRRSPARCGVLQSTRAPPRGTAARQLRRGGGCPLAPRDNSPGGRGGARVTRAGAVASARLRLRLRRRGSCSVGGPPDACVSATTGRVKGQRGAADGLIE